jgi:hypothetical protein
MPTARSAETGRPAANDAEQITDLLWVLTGFEAFEHFVAEGRNAAEIADLIFTAAERLTV